MHGIWVTTSPSYNMAAIANQLTSFPPSLDVAWRSFLTKCFKAETPSGYEQKLRSLTTRRKKLQKKKKKILRVHFPDTLWYIQDLLFL